MLDLEEPEAGAGSGSGSATGKPKDKPKGKPKAQRGKRTTVSSEPHFITFTFAWLSAVLLVLAVAGFWCLHWCLGLLGRVAPRELLAAAWLFGYLSRLPQDIPRSLRRVSLCLSCEHGGAGCETNTGPCCWRSCSCSPVAASMSSSPRATAPSLRPRSRVQHGFVRPLDAHFAHHARCMVHRRPRAPPCEPSGLNHENFALGKRRSSEARRSRCESRSEGRRLPPPAPLRPPHPPLPLPPTTPPLGSHSRGPLSNTVTKTSSRQRSAY